jgi:hypothetical protein
LASAALALSLLGLLACQQIAGIERRSFAARDGGAGDAASELQYPNEDQCTKYCALLSEGCSESTSGVFAYKKDTDYCTKLCAHLPLATSKLLKSHSFECRLDQAMKAFTVKGDPNEGSGNCKSAGAGGNGTCGTNCEAYCQMFADVCEDYPQRSNCMSECLTLRDDDSSDADNAFSNNVDTLQCRLTHLGAAASDPDTHCAHAAIYTPDVYTPCMSAKPRCEDYCAFTQNVCTQTDTQDLRQYESVQECLEVCSKGLTDLPAPAENKQDTNRDTLACRKYHTYNALINDTYHCNHAGPTGDGHCGKICPAYCKLVKAACSDGYAKEYPSGDAACQERCATFLGNKAEDKQLDLGYSVSEGQKNGPTIQCRFYHTVKAFSKPNDECNSALGLQAGDCD